MKRVFQILAILLVSIGFSCASYRQTDPALLKSTDYVFDFPGQSADQIYDKSMAWFATIFNSANDVVQLRDKENHQIIGKGVGGAVYRLVERKFTFTIQVDTKNDKSRLRIFQVNPMSSLESNIWTGQSMSVSGLDVTNEEQYLLAKDYFTETAKSYKDFILKQSKDKDF